mgnify:CR=1 FL=1
MKLYYSAIFLKEDDGRYLVSFSDVPEAITCGNDFENLDINRFVNSSSVIYDVKGVLNSKMVAGRL